MREGGRHMWAKSRLCRPSQRAAQCVQGCSGSGPHRASGAIRALAHPTVALAVQFDQPLLVLRKLRASGVCGRDLRVATGGRSITGGRSEREGRRVGEREEEGEEEREGLLRPQSSPTSLSLQTSAREGEEEAERGG
eukprot:285306-Rhodomonas_salina.2